MHMFIDIMHVLFTYKRHMTIVYAVPRPYCQEFITECFRTFETVSILYDCTDDNLNIVLERYINPLLKLVSETLHRDVALEYIITYDNKIEKSMVTPIHYIMKSKRWYTMKKMNMVVVTPNVHLCRKHKNFLYIPPCDDIEIDRELLESCTKLDDVSMWYKTYKTVRTFPHFA